MHMNLEMTTGSSIDKWAYGINAYPNPASDHLHIQVNGSEQLSGLVIELCDIAGKVIQTHTALAHTRISVNTLAPGLYIIRLGDASGHTYATSKLVVDGRY